MRAHHKKQLSMTRPQKTRHRYMHTSTCCCCCCCCYWCLHIENSSGLRSAPSNVLTGELTRTPSVVKSQLTRGITPSEYNSKCMQTYPCSVCCCCCCCLHIRNRPVLFTQYLHMSILIQHLTRVNFRG
ncbi:unnamed protein product, partial [Ectocarpus sp. 12 AP-2014]